MNHKYIELSKILNEADQPEKEKSVIGQAVKGMVGGAAAGIVATKATHLAGTAMGGRGGHALQQGTQAAKNAIHGNPNFAQKIARGANTLGTHLKGTRYRQLAAGGAAIGTAAYALKQHQKNKQIEANKAIV